eukprot:2632163-Rhodomonas_salina.1
MVPNCYGVSSAISAGKSRLSDLRAKLAEVRKEESTLHVDSQKSLENLGALLVLKERMGGEFTCLQAKAASLKTGLGVYVESPEVRALALKGGEREDAFAAFE